MISNGGDLSRASVTEADTGSVVSPAGTAAGDSAILILFGNGSLFQNGSGWTEDVASELLAIIFFGWKIAAGGIAGFRTL
jgi:hypothetical protein